MKEILTFELSKDGDQLEIHGDAEGLQSLVSAIQRALRDSDHQHLLSEDWGGNDLTSERQGVDNTLLHHVKIMLWSKKC